MDDYNSDISNGCMLYPVFCTVPIDESVRFPLSSQSHIPPAKPTPCPPSPKQSLPHLNSLITSSRLGLADISGGDSAALYFVDSHTGTPITRGSHKPMSVFKSSWVGKSVEDVYAYYREVFSGKNNGLSDHCFVVVDGETFGEGGEGKGKGTVVLASDVDGNGEGGGLVTFRADFWSVLYQLVPIEMGTVKAGEVKGRVEGKGGVFRREVAEGDSREYEEGIEGKKERGEPLNEIERKVDEGGE